MASANQTFVIFFIVVLCAVGEILCDEDMDNSSVSEARTFGHHFLKRISFAIIPAAFVVGVITTLLAALTVVSLKSMGIGAILLVLALSQLLSRSLPQAAPIQGPIPIVYANQGGNW